MDASQRAGPERDRGLSETIAQNSLSRLNHTWACLWTPLTPQRWSEFTTTTSGGVCDGHRRRRRPVAAVADGDHTADDHRHMGDSVVVLHHSDPIVALDCH
jgi:hypothetical protein